jgi:hypothetical protein
MRIAASGAPDALKHRAVEPVNKVKTLPVHVGSGQFSLVHLRSCCRLFSLYEQFLPSVAPLVLQLRGVFRQCMVSCNSIGICSGV